MLRGAMDLFAGLDAAPVLILTCLYRATSRALDMTTLLAGRLDRNGNL